MCTKLLCKQNFIDLRQNKTLTTIDSRINHFRFLENFNYSDSNMNIFEKNNSFTLNQDLPSIFIPKNAIFLLDPILKISFTFVNDPKPFNQLGPKILSKIVTVVAFSKKTTIFEYPQQADWMVITIPWFSIPYNNIDYPFNCKVCSYNGKKWIITNSCKVESKTNKTTAIISCNRFGTYGLICNEDDVDNLKSNISARYISISVLFSLLFIFY